MKVKNNDIIEYCCDEFSRNDFEFRFWDNECKIDNECTYITGIKFCLFCGKKIEFVEDDDD